MLGILGGGGGRGGGVIKRYLGTRGVNIALALVIFILPVLDGKLSGKKYNLRVSKRRILEPNKHFTTNIMTSCLEGRVDKKRKGGKIERKRR
jgi:hypothetical protein